MGGYGSGRPQHKRQAEHFRSLNVNTLKRSGSLKEGRQGTWQWSQGSEVIAHINFHTSEGRLMLDYRVCVNGSDWEPITQHIGLSQVPCHLGGHRTYFICSGVVNGRSCRRQVGKLYAGGRYFLCRHCYGMAYTSQSEDRASRMLRRANKIRMALGGEAGTASWIAPKPKGMWHRTYQGKRFEIEWCESQADHHFIAKFAHLLSKEDREMYFS